MAIHPTALVSPNARLARGVAIGPYSIVGDGVSVGEECEIGAFATLEGPMEMGPRNRVYNYAALGTNSQDLKFQGGETGLVVGEGNIFREYVTINRASDPGGRTVVGNFNVFMAHSHVAHNCVVGNHAIFANAASLAGHCVIDDHAILGGLVAVHQFCRVGEHAFAGAGAKLVKDVPPFCIADGVPARLAGINRVGLERRGYEAEDIREIKRLFACLFRKSGNLARAIEELRAQGVDNRAARGMLDFIASSQRGVCAPIRHSRHPQAAKE
jgi:UDP-N-acetylglucosamine acyltransferase